MPDNLLSPDRLTEKIGKFPIWAWGLIGGTVVLGGYYFVKARKNARVSDAGVNGSVSDNLASVFTGMATSDQTDEATLPVSGYTGNTISNGDNALGDANLETNVTWLNRGIKVATNQGNTALGATLALQKYLQGKPVNKNEEAVVNKVLQALGYPPEGSPLLVKAIQDAKGTYVAPPADKGNTGVKPTAPTVTPKPAPKPTPTVSGGTGANGYPLDSQGREVIEVTKSFPKKIISGKFAGKMKPFSWDTKKVIYVEVDKAPQTIPASPTR
jgi:hypothetical protein